MDRLIKWWKTDRRYMAWLKALFMACLPLMACVVYCSLEGRSIGQVYLPSSGLNDELFYYKQVEAIVHYGYPQGFFGFNESHALRLSFAAWSPVLILPWVLWGLLFGWNLWSPIQCNIFLLSMGMFLFTLLAKPDRRQTGILTLLFFLYTPFSWYMLSCMPEIICMSLLMVFYGLAVAYLRERKGGKLALLFALSGLLTLMRPYMLLFMLLPAFFWMARGGEASLGRGKSWLSGSWKPLVGSGVIIAAVLGCYACINHFLAAPYFEPLYNMGWLTAFWEKGFLGGLRNFFSSLYYSGMEFWRYLQQGLRSGLAAGAIFCCYMAMLSVLLYQSLRDFYILRRGRRGAAYRAADGRESVPNANAGRGAAHRAADGRESVPNANAGRGAAHHAADRQGTAAMAGGRLVLEAHLAISFLGMLVAQLLMKNLYDGCKHLLTFLAAGILVVSLMETAAFKKAVFLGVVFALFFAYNREGFRDYQASFLEAGVEASLESWGAALREEAVLTGDTRPNFDNVVIWVLTDQLPEGTASTGWQYLYALPPGFGISCCTSEYVMGSFDGLQGRYLCVVPGGPVEDRCLAMGYEKLAENEYAVLYRRY